MDAQERQVRIELLGQEYWFFTAATDEEVEAILSLVRGLVKTDATAHPGTLVSVRVVTLACLNIASQYVRLKTEFDHFRLENNRRLQEVAAAIEEDLDLPEEG
ncbi:MAG: cell division protein ZapA [Desulfobulbaceae bacterium]|jgi:cell division protein ZapA|nr:cell division protein ZapA [Desulfobulbaceae bacterium]